MGVGGGGGGGGGGGDGWGGGGVGGEGRVEEMQSTPMTLGPHRCVLLNALIYATPSHDGGVRAEVFGLRCPLGEAIMLDYDLTAVSRRGGGGGGAAYFMSVQNKKPIKNAPFNFG